MGSGPTVLCIGAQKAGTTWLYRGLEGRDDVWLPPVKELHFFDEKIVSDMSWFDHMHGERAPSARWRRQVAAERIRRSRHADDPDEPELREWTGRYFFEAPTVDWYLSLFPKDGRASLDTSPEYALLDEDRIGRVVDILPDVKVIYLLRNPIEREWSGTQMRYRKNPARGPETVLAGRHPHVRYRDNIDRWSSALPDGRLYVGFFDDIAARPRELLADIVSFIGADADRIELPEGRPNAGNVSTIPAELAVALAEDLADEIDGLAVRFGGPASEWSETAARLRGERPAGEIAYPFAASADRRRDSISSIRI